MQRTAAAFEPPDVEGLIRKYTLPVRPFRNFAAFKDSKYRSALHTGFD